MVGGVGGAVPGAGAGVEGDDDAEGVDLRTIGSQGSVSFVELKELETKRRKGRGGVEGAAGGRGVKPGHSTYSSKPTVM